MSATPEPAPPETPGFELRGRLGSGGMGVVFRALDQRTGQQVALKWLPQATGVKLSRFKQEFRALADILHPNLLPLFALQSVADTWFFTMQLVEGTTFLGWVRPGGGGGRAPATGFSGRTLTSTRDGTAVDGIDRGRASAPTARGPDVGPAVGHLGHLDGLDAGRLRATLPQLVDGVRALHAAGKLHRDLKPSNVLIDPTGHVYVADFGIVLDTHGDGDVDPGVIIGTPGYMSPEQDAGASLSPASDWYAVGTMLFEALTGCRPFAGTVDELVAQRRAVDAPPVRALAPALPRALDDLADLAAALLQREPAARPDGAAVRARLGGATSELRTAAASAAGDGSGTAFVGRAAELAALHHALAASGDGCVAVLVAGASGMGKTALLGHFAAQAAAAGALVLTGRCYQRESVPFKALDSIVDALTRHLRALPAAALPALPGANVEALCRLFPVLRQVPWPTPDVAPPPLPPQRLLRRAIVGFRELIAALAAARQVVLIVDDLQWGDVDSVGFFVELLHHAAAPPALLLAAHRQEDAAATPLRTALRAAGAPPARPGALRELAVAPLQAPDVTALVRALSHGALGDDTIDAVARESGGSPLFASELTRAGAAPIGGAPRPADRGARRDAVAAGAAAAGGDRRRR